MPVKSEKIIDTQRRPGNGVQRHSGEGLVSADDSTADVVSVKSVDSKASTTSKKHGRNKSSLSSGLKKLGKLGGKRRTDSVTSTDTK